MLLPFLWLNSFVWPCRLLADLGTHPKAHHLQQWEIEHDCQLEKFRYLEYSTLPKIQFYLPQFWDPDPQELLWLRAVLLLYLSIWDLLIFLFSIVRSDLKFCDRCWLFWQFHLKIGLLWCLPGWRRALTYFRHYSLQKPSSKWFQSQKLQPASAVSLLLP